MITCEVEINGTLVAVAGDAEMSVLTAIVTATGKLGAASNDTLDPQERPTVDLHVGGMTSPTSGGEQESIEWIAQPLAIGDVVVVRVRESDHASAPSVRKPANVDAEVEHGMFKHARATYFRLRDKYEKSDS